MAFDTTFCLLAATCVLLVYYYFLNEKNYCAVAYGRETGRENADPEPRYPLPHKPTEAPAARPLREVVAQSSSNSSNSSISSISGISSIPEEHIRYMSVGSRVKEHMERRSRASHKLQQGRREALLRTLALDLKADPSMKAVNLNAPSGLP